MKILGHTYKLIRTPCLPLAGSFGTFLSGKLEISIATDLPESQQQTAIVHELIEAINSHLKLGLDEGTIWRLEAGLFQVLTENGVDLSPLLKENNAQ